MKMTREQIINALIKDDMDKILSGSDSGIEYLQETLMDGFKGFNEYSDAELVKEYNETFDVKIELDKYMTVNEAVRVIKDHLDEADLDELTDILSYISGAKVFIDPEDSDYETLMVEVNHEEYAGMFDKILKDERGK